MENEKEIIAYKGFDKDLKNKNEKEDLAEEYALEEYARVNGESDPIFTDNRCFTFDDIKYAFNAGRESVVENMLKLKWNDFSDGLENYYASCPIGWCYKVSYKANEFALFCNDSYLGSFLSIKEAKQAANEDYKKRIKQALGL